MDKTDAAGNVVRDGDGRPLQMKVIDEDDRPHVVDAARLFLDERWSLGKLARLFNKLKVAGSNKWTHRGD